MAAPVLTGEYFEHITGPGERWDTIAHQYYNNAGLSHLIIEANRDGGDIINNPVQFLQPIPVIIPSGAVLRVPVIDVPSIDENLLPPWKRK